jgi:hypothetical protein
LIALLAVALAGLAVLAALLRRKSALHWLPDAVACGARNFFIRRPAPVHVLLAVVDHFEPGRDDAPPEVAAARLAAWLERWPAVAGAWRDADGRPPRQTFCYPWDEWRDGEVAALGALCYDGLAEIELHLHHHDDTAETLRAKLLAATAAFGQWGALLACGDPTEAAYGFVHGDWALDNSHPRGEGCGVNGELAVLAATGCYADFTLPTPDACQPRTVNRIYRANGDPRRGRGPDRGAPLTVGRAALGELLLIPGPLGFNLRDWHHRGYPAIERAELAAPSPVTPARVEFWLRTGVGVRGAPGWVFVKLHTHGCRERDQEELLGEGRHRLHRLLAERCDGRRAVLHYCTARELANLALAAESGADGEPEPWRDWRLAPPVNTRLATTTPVDVTALAAGRGAIRNRSAESVDWRLRVGPLARVCGDVAALAWTGAHYQVEARGPWRAEAR